MKRITLTALAFTAAAYSSATIFTYTSALNGFQQVPPTNSAAIANVILQLNDVSLTLTGTGTITSQFLTSPITDFHVHGAPFGVNGPVIVNIGPSAFSGNAINFTVPVTNFAAVKAQMDAQNTYLNIHTQVFPSGEIRGQIMPVPEPATLAALGLGAAALIRRRRKA